MKKQFLLRSAIVGLVVLFGCRKNTIEEQFIAANEPIAKKYLSHFQVFSDNNTFDNVTYVINYDSDNRVSSITDGSESGFTQYDESNELSTVSDKNGTFDMSELYKAPYNAFEEGEVTKYDSKLNPIKILVYEDGYGSDILVGSIGYDPNPNPFFYTFKAAGLLAVLERVNLYFEPTNQNITKARQLLPYNNISSMIFKDVNGATKYEAQVSYNYDADLYPTSANMMVITPTETTSITLVYSYR
ncbi:MAG TPA: hypothetical protein DCX54_04310 [Flavobacteriales bacterium]|nr:hypothetical protein [Flavobacteriales bacterium]